MLSMELVKIENDRQYVDVEEDQDNEMEPCRCSNWQDWAPWTSWTRVDDPSAVDTTVEETRYRKLISQAVDLWEKEREKENGKPSLGSVIFKCLWKEIVIGLVLSVFAGVAAGLVRPLLLHWLLTMKMSTNVYWICALVGLACFCDAFFLAYTKQAFACRFARGYMIVLTGLIEHHSRAVDTQAVRDSGLEEAALIGADVVRVYEDLRMASQGPWMLVAAICGCSYVISVFGLAGLAGTSVLVCFGFINVYLVIAMRKAEDSATSMQGHRLTLMKEFLESVEFIKMMVWEKPLAEKIFSARKAEATALEKIRQLGFTSQNLGRGMPLFASCAAILTAFFLEKDKFEPINLLIIFLAFRSVRGVLGSLPQATAQVATALTAMERVRTYLLLPCKQYVQWSDAESITFHGASFQWSLSSPPVLSNISLHVNPKRHLVGVVGLHGAGKTSLLFAALGHLGVVNGTASTRRGTPFASQRSLLVNTSVQENILLGSTLHPDRLAKVLTCCRLQHDVEHLLENGLSTKVGERGTSLSGGQAARVCLARALYHGQSELVLLDDPLAALDNVVRADVFHHAVCGYTGRGPDPWDSGSILMSLTQWEFLPFFDEILVLEEGRLVARGSYDELVKDDSQVLPSLFAKLQSEEMRNSRGEDVQEQSHTKPLAGTALDTALDEVDSDVLSDLEDVSFTSYKVEKSGGQGRARSLLQQTERAQTTTRRQVTSRYLASIGALRISLSAFLALVAYSFQVGADIFVVYWSQASGDGSQVSPTLFTTVLISLVLAGGLMTELVSYICVRSAMRATGDLHSKAFWAVIDAPMRWFRATPLGAIMAKFSNDLSLLDRQLAWEYEQFYQRVFEILIMCIVVFVASPLTMVVFALLFMVMIMQVFAIDHKNHPLKTIANQRLEPVLTGASDTAMFRNLIPSFHADSFFRSRQLNALFQYIFVANLSVSLDSFNILLSGVSSFFLTLSGSSLVLSGVGPKLDSDWRSLLDGLSLVYVFVLPNFLQMFTFRLPLGMSCFAAVHRLFNLSRISKEQYVELEPSLDSLDIPAWPTQGMINFDHVTVKYPGTETRTALNDLVLKIEPCEKIGICGRTGAGKSTLVQTLFFLVAPTKGRILIDDIDVSTLPLPTIRKAITVIPQKPVLFNGDIASNLDPFQRCTPGELESVLGKVGLLAPGEGSDQILATHVFSLSSGQRQLLSFARALLSCASTRIVVLDEPTANLDPITDQAIQTFSQTEFRGKTVITIAHRLQSIMGSDRIVLLDKGSVVAIGPPQELAKDPENPFAKLLQAGGSFV